MWWSIMKLTHYQMWFYLTESGIIAPSGWCSAFLINQPMFTCDHSRMVLFFAFTCFIALIYTMYSIWYFYQLTLKMDKDSKGSIFSLLLSWRWHRCVGRSNRSIQGLFLAITSSKSACTGYQMTPVVTLWLEPRFCAQCPKWQLVSMQSALFLC